MHFCDSVKIPSPGLQQHAPQSPNSGARIVLEGACAQSFSAAADSDTRGEAGKNS